MISTHAAHEGAALQVRPVGGGGLHFNSRGPRRGRGAWILPATEANKFQLTRPTKGPRGVTPSEVFASLISTHAAHEGAAASDRPQWSRSSYFNSRGPRRGRDDEISADDKQPKFQLTRPTKGPRLPLTLYFCDFCNFNSRGPRRGRGDLTGLATKFSEFQLTRPTKGPRIRLRAVQFAPRISTHAAHEGAASRSGQADCA